MNAIDLLEELFKDNKPIRDTMGDGSPALNIDYNAYRFHVDENGDVKLICSQWVRLGNIHEPDILDRVTRSINPVTYDGSAVE
jgi:hypothetical protein